MKWSEQNKTALKHLSDAQKSIHQEGLIETSKVEHVTFCLTKAWLLIRHSPKSLQKAMEWLQEAQKSVWPRDIAYFPLKNAVEEVQTLIDKGGEK